MPSDIKECSLYSFTLRGQKIKTTPKDITARAAAQAAQTTANGKQDALTAAQLAAVNSGVTAEKVATYDAFMESDPTVPAWAKAASKPTYTASEVGALPDTTVIPEASSVTPEMDGTATVGSSDDYARADHIHPSDDSKQDALTTAQQEAVNSGVTAAKVAAWDAIEVPTKTSDLTNDSGFITAAAIPAVPTKTSDLTNDSDFVTSAAIPDSTSDLTNDSGFITANDIPAIPSKTSDLQNDSGFITASAIPAIPDSTSDLTNDSGFITALDIPAIPSKTSDLQNDSGFITGYTETDPTVPAWAKAASKPTYTASEVGALPDTTAIPAASSANPEMDGTAAAGSSAYYARADHVHPSDSSKQDALSSTQMDAVNSGITADDLAVNDADVLCPVTPITPILSNGTSYASYGGCYYYKIGHRVTIHVGVSSITAKTKTVLWTLPSGYRPKATIVSTGLAIDIQYYSRVRITSDGTVMIYSESAYALVEVSFDAFV